MNNFIIVLFILLILIAILITINIIIINYTSIVKLPIRGGTTTITIENRDAFINADNVFTIPEGVVVTKIDDYVFFYNKDYFMIKLTGPLVIPPSVEEIGNRSFQSQSDVTSIIFENPRESKLKKIGDKAFYQLENAQGELVIPPSVEEINRDAFFDNANLA